MQSLIEQERKRRINVSVWAYAYEIDNEPLVSDEEYDRECRLVDLSIETGRLDEWFRANFQPDTGMWIHNHPELDRVENIYNLILQGRRRMKLSNLIASDDVIEEAFAQPVMKIAPRSKKRPTLETAMKVVLNTIEKQITAHMAAEIKALVEPEYDMHILMDGEHEEAEKQDEWELAVDDMLERIVEPYHKVLSQNWLGIHLIDAGLQDVGGLDKWCNSFGKEYYKQLTYGINPEDVLKDAGITKEVVEARLSLHNTPTEQEIKKMADQQEISIDEVAAKIAAHVGKGYTVMNVYDDLDQASDDDEILAAGAAARLGISEDDISVLQMERLTIGQEVVDVVLQKVDEIVEGSPKAKKKGGKKAEGAAIAREKAPAAPTPAPAKQTVPAATESGITAVTLTALKECGAQDTIMAKSLGVSRATYNNYVNGKTVLSPSAEQSGYIRGEVVDRINKLYEALAEIDGTEAEMVF